MVTPNLSGLIKSGPITIVMCHFFSFFMYSRSISFLSLFFRYNLNIIFVLVFSLPFQISQKNYEKSEDVGKNETDRKKVERDIMEESKCVCVSPLHTRRVCLEEDYYLLFYSDFFYLGQRVDICKFRVL